MILTPFQSTSQFVWFLQPSFFLKFYPLFFSLPTCSPFNQSFNIVMFADPWIYSSPSFEAVRVAALLIFGIELSPPLVTSFFLMESVLTLLQNELPRPNRWLQSPMQRSLCWLLMTCNPYSKFPSTAHKTHHKTFPALFPAVLPPLIALHRCKCYSLCLGNASIHSHPEQGALSPIPPCDSKGFRLYPLSAVLTIWQYCFSLYVFLLPDCYIWLTV